MRDAGEGPVDVLTPCPNRDAPVLPPAPANSVLTLLSPLKVAV
jgi:hypothetical protein